MYVHIKGSSFCTMLNPAMFQDSQFADVTFICGDKSKVKAHRLIIGSVSSLLKSCLAQADSFEIVLPDFSSTDVDNLLRFIYEGLVRLQGEEILQFKSLFQLLKLEIPVHIATEQGDNVNEEVWASGGVNSERKDTATKRKASSPLSCPSSSKVLKMREKYKCDPAIQGLNNSIANISVPLNTEGSSPVCKPLPKPIPLKYFKDFVCRLEKNKAEKNLKKMVEEAVQKQLQKEKEDIENITKTVKLELKRRDAEILELKENMKQANSQSCKKALITKSSSIQTEEQSSKALQLKNENVVIAISPSSLSTSPNLLTAQKKGKVSMSSTISRPILPERNQIVSSKSPLSSLSNLTTNLVAREQKINQVVSSKCPPSSLSTSTSNTEAKQQKINQAVSSKCPASSLSTSSNVLAAQKKNEVLMSTTISGSGPILPEKNQGVSSKCPPSTLSNSTAHLVAREQKINQIVSSKCPPSSLSTSTSNTEAKQQKIKQVVSTKSPPSSLSAFPNLLTLQKNKFSSATISGAVLPKNNQVANPSDSLKLLLSSKTASSTFVSTMQPSKQLNPQNSAVTINKACVKLASSFNIKNHTSEGVPVAMASTEDSTVNRGALLSSVKEAHIKNNTLTPKRVSECKSRILSDKSSPEEIKKIMKIIEITKKQHDADAKATCSSKLSSPNPNQKSNGNNLVVPKAYQKIAPKLLPQSTLGKASKAYDGHYPDNVRTVVSLSDNKGIAPTTAIARTISNQMGDTQDPVFNPVGASSTQVRVKHMQPQKALQSVQQPPSASAGSALPSRHRTIKVVTLINGKKVTVISRPSV